MAIQLARCGADIDAFEYCPYHPQAVVERYRQSGPRRKAAPDMVTDLLARQPVDASRSFLMDKQSEAEAAAGIRGFLFLRGGLGAFVRAMLSAERNSIP